MVLLLNWVVDSKSLSAAVMLASYVLPVPDVL